MLEELRYRRSLLAYPAGARASVNLNHPAAAGIKLSAVFQGSNFVDLTTGMPGVVTGSPVIGIDAGIGPSAYVSAGTDVWRFPGKPAVVDAQCTMAVIVSARFSGGGQQFYFHNSTNSTNAFHMSCGDDDWRTGANTAAVTMLTIAGSRNNQHKYFFGVTINGTKWGMVVRDLTTGKVYSATTTNALNGAASNGSYEIGNYAAFSVFGLNPLAAAMYSNRSITQAALLRWADDPWAFWYPQSDLPKVGPAAVALGAVYLDPTQLGTNIVLSNLNLTATQMAAATANTRAIAYHASGKYYCEFTVDVTGDMQVGICNAVTPLTEYLGQDNTHSIGVDDTSGWVGAGGITTAPGLINGHTYGLAIDINSKKAWIKDITAGGFWNANASADPVTGVNGATFTTIT